MWPSPSKIPANISFTSSGNLIKALSEKDKRSIPFLVGTVICTTGLDTKNNTGILSRFI